MLLDAAYVKLRNGEPMSLNDFHRIVNLLVQAPMPIQQPTDDEKFGAYNSFITKIQDKFKFVQ